jgi:LacI family transcriptional regulator
MSVRMKDIARSLGVSQTTVSHVLSGRDAEFRIGAETAERVRAEARRLRYQPSALARGFKQHRSFAIALAVGDLANPFWAGLAVAAQQEAQRHGYVLVVNHTGESRENERQLLELLRERRVDGLILSAAHLRASDLTALREERRPLVLVDRTIEGFDFPSVVTDSMKGLHLAVDHLVRKGHRRIGYLGGPVSITTFRDRLAAFRRSLAARRLRPVRYIASEAEPEHARIAAAAFLKGRSVPTAVIAANIWLTVGALRALPADMDIVGFDDLYLADMLRRPITTIAHPVEELGRRAVCLLLDEIVHPGGKRHIVLPPRLVVR